MTDLVSNSGLAGRRILVVGASSGIGRALAAQAARAGGRVVATARRAERLEDLRREGHGDLTVVGADVRRDADCAAVVERTVAVLGGLDALIYAAGMSNLSPLQETDGEAWRMILETNVVGAALTCRAALPHLVASQGRAVFLSSVSSDDPRPFLVAYGASKAALDAQIKGWRSEHPNTAFIRIGVGPTSTGFGSGWTQEQVAKLTEMRTQRGLLRARPMTPDQCAEAILNTVASPVWIEEVKLMPDNTVEAGS